MREKAEKPAKRKLTRAERKQIEAVIRQAKGDGKAHTVQDSIPFQNMFPDGLCRLEGGAFSKTIAFEDVNYRLAGPEDQRSIFESLCDFYNGYDPSIGVQVSLDSRSGGSAADEMFGIRRQGNDLDPIRDEAVDILRMQYKRGNNGYVKTKYVTLTIEAENLPAARARFARIETDTLNRFKVMGAAAHVLDGKERLELLYNILHPEGGQFAFEWDWLPASGLSVKDFISPSSFHFGETRTFRIGKRYGAVSFLQILAPEMHDRILTDFMEADGNIMVTMHIRGINQNEAIKMVKRKITDLDAMKIQEQKRAVRSGYDMDILPSDLSTYGGAAKDLLTDLQSRNERMFNMTFLVLHTAETRQKLEIAVSQAASVAQTYNCLLTRLDFQQEDGLMSSLPLGLNRIKIPSIAYGFKRCSLKHKIGPQEKFCNHYPPCQKAWAAGKRVVKFIGYDAGEGYRSDKVLLGDLADRKYSKWYPLMEWGWTRDDCIRQIEAAGLPQPGKSSCFFCPSMKPDEITALREQHPDLFRRALALEDNARKNLKTVKGLGRNYSWRERFGKEFCTHGNG